jgi:hypothetical protein
VTQTNAATPGTVFSSIDGDFSQMAAKKEIAANLANKHESRKPKYDSRLSRAFAAHSSYLLDQRKC